MGGIGNGGGRVSIAIKDVKRRAQEIKRSKPLMEWPDELRWNPWMMGWGSEAATGREQENKQGKARCCRRSMLLCSTEV